MVLDQDMRLELQSAQRKYSKYVREYGLNTNHNNNRGRRPCKRIQNPNKVYRIKNKQYKPYQIEWMLANNQLLSQHKQRLNMELSHKCGNPRNKKIASCIQVSHLTLESHQANLQRKKCHYQIRYYINSKKHPKTTQKLTAGPIFVRDIPLKTRKRQRSRKKIKRKRNPNRHPKRKKKNNSKEEADVDDTTQEEKEQETNEQDAQSLTCLHDFMTDRFPSNNACFINYKLIP